MNQLPLSDINHYEGTLTQMKSKEVEPVLYRTVLGTLDGSV